MLKSIQRYNPYQSLLPPWKNAIAPRDWGNSVVRVNFKLLIIIFIYLIITTEICEYQINIVVNYVYKSLRYILDQSQSKSILKFLVRYCPNLP